MALFYALLGGVENLRIWRKLVYRSLDDEDIVLKGPFGLNINSKKSNNNILFTLSQSLYKNINNTSWDFELFLSKIQKYKILVDSIISNQMLDILKENFIIIFLPKNKNNVG